MNPAADQLQKYECDICNKAKQIAGLKDCLIRCQHNLNEKTNEAFVLEQKYSKLCSDYNAIQMRLKEYEGQGARSSIGSSMGAENASLGQELRRNQDLLQQKHQDMLAAQQNLLQCDRELERIRQEYEDLRNFLSQREFEIKRLSEENSCLANKVAQLGQRLEIETCELKNQMAEMKCRLEKENEFLRNRQREMEENNALLMQNLQACQRQMSGADNCAQKLDQLTRQLEDLRNKLAEREEQIQCLLNRQREMEENNALLMQNLQACQRQMSGADNYAQKIDQLTRQLEDLRNKLAEREDQIARYRECLNQRDTEIAQLKSLLCSSSRCGDNCSNNHCFSQSNVLVFNSSDLDNLNQDKMDSPLLLNVSYPVGGSASRNTNISNKQWTHNGKRDSINKFLNGSLSKEDNLFEPDCQDSKNSTSASNSIGATEVQERLRSNQIRQIEIERQLKCLEEETVEDTPRLNIFQAGVESEPVQS